jgi:exodeoxyribonuclease VII large subunit
MSVHYRAIGSAIILFGNTYPLRERIKALGGRYNGPDKNWRLPLSEQNLSLVDELCRASGGGALGAPAAPLAARVVAAEATVPAPAEESAASPAAAGLTIRELVGRAAAAISQAFPKSLWVVGEIQNVSHKKTGIYFDLAEARGSGHQSATLTVRAVLWSHTAQELSRRHGPDAVREILQDGMQVRCLCQVQLYRDRGSLSLLLEDLDPSFTKGALALARERLLKELRAKGLDQANKRRPMPPFPFRVGLVSAEGSRAQSDFLDQLRQGGFPGEVVFCPTPMQGDGVPALVAAALARLARAGCDVIVLTRGGGSAADLRWFDAPEIAYAIAACPLPVIAAIGHHEDVCVAEEVCHLRQKTPTAAADFVLDVFRQTKERIERLAQESAAALDRKLEQATQLQATLAERLALRSQEALTRRHELVSAKGNDLERVATAVLTRMSQILTQRGGTLATAAADCLRRAEVALTQKIGGIDAAAQQRLGAIDKALVQSAARVGTLADAHLARATMRLAELDGELGRRNPGPWMSRGWTQFTGPRGPVRRRADLGVGELVRARLRDAVVELRVERLEEREGSAE